MKICSHPAIERVEYTENDFIVVYAGIGNLPPLKAKEYCEELKTNLIAKMGHQNFLIFPQGGVSSCTLAVLTKKA